MDQTSVLALLKVLAAIGPSNLMVLIVLPGGLALMLSVCFLVLYMRRTDKLMLRTDTLVNQYRDDTRIALQQAREHQSELREMYENNVLLVEQTQNIATSLQTTVVRNTEALTRLAVEISQNQYCPLNRLEKQAKGPQ